MFSLSIACNMTEKMYTFQSLRGQHCTMLLLKPKLDLYFCTGMLPRMIRGTKESNKENLKEFFSAGRENTVK